MCDVTYPIGVVEPGRCQWCGKPSGFLKNGRAKKWCGDYCATSASSFRLTGRVAPLEKQDAPKMCAGCGEPLPVMKRQGNPRRWCSESCRVAAYRRRNPEYRQRSADAARRRAAEREALKPPKPRCAHCGDEMHCRRSDVKYCGKRECQAAKRAAALASAPECFVDGCSNRVRARGMCSTHYVKTWATENREKHLANVRTQGMRYRARKRGAFVENVHRDDVLERDGWRCQICGKKIPKTAAYPDPLSPSVDHVVPLSLGGKHEMKNVQAAHLICNAVKSDVGAGDQLALL